MLDVYTKPVMKSPNRLPIGTNPRGKPLGGNGATRKIPQKRLTEKYLSVSAKKN